MTSSSTRIVVGVDGSAGSREALVWALAEAVARDARVEVLSAYPVDLYWIDPHLLDDRRLDSLRSETGARIRAMVDDARLDPALVALGSAADVDVVVAAGAPALHLVQRSEGAELLVVGSRGRGALRSAVAGSVALHCAAHARCPVVVVHPAPAPADGQPRVVVGLDDSEPARAALATAAARAAAAGARLDVVVALEVPDLWADVSAEVPPPDGETEQRARARAGSVVQEVLGADALRDGAVRVVVTEGDPRDVLLREAAGARLLAVGCRSRNAIQGVALGSVALHCVMHAHCPVLVLHPHS